MAAAPKHMKRTGPSPLKVAGIVAGTLLGLIVAAYFGGVAYFSSHLWPNSTIGGVDVSLATAQEAADALQEALDARSVTVSGDGVVFTVGARDAGMSSNSLAAVQGVMGARSPWTWPLELTGRHSADDVVRSSCDADKLASFVSDAIAEHNACAEAPVDASLFYDEASGLYRIDPGSPGGVIEGLSVVARVIEAFGSDEPFAYLTGADLVPQNVTADSPKLVGSRDSANALLACDVRLTVAGVQVARLESSSVVQWVSFADNGQAVLDSKAVRAWGDSVEALVDDVGATRQYVRTDGKQVTVSGGSYGWVSDGDALEALLNEAIRNGADADLDVPLKQSATTFNHGGQEWGPRYIDVDLSEQYVRFYGSDGSIMWSSPCISGAAGAHDTPPGVWYVNNKALDQTLIGLDEDHDGEPDYRTPVTYWMPFEGNLVAFHDAQWQPDFGGSLYAQGYGSHGCINLPPDAAASLYDIVRIGDVVVVHY